MAPRSVMLIEDDGVIARDLSDTLGELGFRVTGVASSADDALHLAAHDTPDVALVDIRIHGARDGIETASELFKRHRVPVVFLSAYADEITVARARRAGPFGYLVKPFRAAEIKTSIEVALYRAQMERALAERHQWFETTIDSLDDAIVCADEHGRVQLLNRAAERLTGWDATAARGLPLASVLQLERPQADPCHPARSDLEGLGAVLRHRDGGETMVSRREAPIVADGRALGTVQVLRDIGDEFRLRAQVEFLERMAALGTLAASVAHEVNNPLSVVLGNLDLVLAAEGVAPLGSTRADAVPRMSEAMRRELLVDVRDAATRIRTIIGDLRALWQPPEPAAEGVASVEQTVAWALDVTSHETRHFARVESSVEPAMRVPLSHVRLGQVLINLVRNAAQALTPGRRGVVRVDARRAEGRCAIRVSDNGPGIPPEVQARLFEPFFTTRAHENGMGLGLYVSRRIVHAAGGELRLESRLGEGTTFIVTLPLVAEAGDDAPVVALTPRREPSSGRILLVDDDAATIMALARVLERHHHVTTANGGLAALERLEEDTSYDLVLLDLMMPDLPGDQVYARICERFPAVEPRVMLITAGAISHAARELVTRLGPRVLRKPLSAQELLDSVGRFLDAQELIH